MNMDISNMEDHMCVCVCVYIYIYIYIYIGDISTEKFDTMTPFQFQTLMLIINKECHTCMKHDTSVSCIKSIEVNASIHKTRNSIHRIDI